MTTNNIVSMFLLSGLFSLSACQTKQKTKEEPKGKPNVLFIVVDDLRPELNCYGESHIISPNIDKLASTGITFSNAYCNVAVCGASRASMLTGARPNANRFLTYHSWAEKDYPEATTLPEHFKENGYVTISNGKVFHHYPDSKDSWSKPVYRPDKIPVDNWRDYVSKENIELEKEFGSGNACECIDVPDTAYADGKVAEKTIRDLRMLKKSGKPFFLAVGFLKPHLPFNPPKKYWDLYKREEMQLADNPFKPKDAPDAAMHNFIELRNYYDVPDEGLIPDDMARMLIHGYNACVSYTDAMIGKVLDELDRLEMSDNTIVVLVGDHGWNLGEHGLWCKHCTFETSLHSPLIVRVPGFEKAKKAEAIAEYIDIYPTLSELCGLQQPIHLDGHSLVDVLKDPADPGKGYAIGKYGNGVTLIKPPYFYTEWHKRDGSKQYARMLYDHDCDPDENINISEKIENSGLIKKLSEELHSKWGKDYFSYRPSVEAGK